MGVAAAGERRSRGAAEQQGSGIVLAIPDTKILCRGQNMSAPTRMLGPNWQHFDMSPTYPADAVTTFNKAAVVVATISSTLRPHLSLRMPLASSLPLPPKPPPLTMALDAPIHPYPLPSPWDCAPSTATTSRCPSSPPLPLHLPPAFEDCHIFHRPIFSSWCSTLFCVDTLEESPQYEGNCRKSKFYVVTTFKKTAPDS